MNRIFHARIAIGQYLFLVLTTIIVIYAMWMQHAVMAVLFMLLLVIAIERLIHTTYTLTTDNKIRIDYQAKADQDTVFNFTNHSYFNLEGQESSSVMDHVVTIYAVKYGTRGKCAVLLPVKEDMFIKTLTNRLNEVKKY